MTTKFTRTLRVAVGVAFAVVLIFTIMNLALWGRALPSPRSGTSLVTSGGTTGERTNTRSEPEAPFADQRQSVLRPELVAGWPTFTNQKYGFTIQYPPHWFKLAPSDHNFDVSNIPFDQYWNGGYLPPGTAEMQLAVVDKQATASFQALEKQFLAYQGRAESVTLRNGASAYRVDVPDDSYEPGASEHRDIIYYIPSRAAVYYAALLYRDIPDVPALENTFSQFVSSLGILQPSP